MNLGILLLVLLAGVFIYLIIIIRQQQNHTIDLYKKINKLESKIEEIETSVQNMPVKDSFSIDDDSTIIRGK